MDAPRREKDVAALRTTTVCVGLSGLSLAFVILLAEGGSWVLAVVCGAVGIGVVLLGLWRRPSASLSRPSRILLFWVLLALLVLEVMVPLNYATGRRHLSFDWTEGSIRQLSDRSLEVLKLVKKPLHVTTFFVRAQPEQAAIFNVTRDLLEQYRRANPHIVIEHVDPSREAEKMLALKKQMKLEDLSNIASVVFQYGDARKDVSLSRLAPVPPPGTRPEEAAPGEYAFYGEQAFTSAVLEVTEENRKVLCFTSGHGEPALEKELAGIASQLRRDNYDVEKLADLGGGVPDNCSVLIILGPNPRAPFSSKEVEAVARFLVCGGKLFFAVNAGGATGLEPLLNDYGISVGRNMIIDTSSGRGSPTVPLQVSAYHDIANPLRSYSLQFSYARTVDAMPVPRSAVVRGAPHAVTLLATGKSCWAESDVDSITQGKPVAMDAKDRRGPVGVAAAYEPASRTPGGEEIRKDIPRTKIVAVGAADFMFGERVAVFYKPPPEGNVLFFFNALNWLAEKEELISIPPKRFDYRPMDELKPSDERLVFWIAVVGIPACSLVLGGVIWLMRRRT